MTVIDIGYHFTGIRKTPQFQQFGSIYYEIQTCFCKKTIASYGNKLSIAVNICYYKISHLVSKISING